MCRLLLWLLHSQMMDFKQLIPLRTVINAMLVTNVLKGRQVQISYPTLGVISFALYCVFENKSIRSAISSLLRPLIPDALREPATDGEAAIIAPRPAVASIRTLPPSNTAAPWGREDPPGHPFPANFFLTARLRRPEPGIRFEFRATAMRSPRNPGCIN